jgi:predicted acyl esterase
MKRMITLFAMLALLGSAVAEVTSDGREWAQAGAPFDAAPILKDLAPGTVHHGVWIPMRDGIKLASEIFLPAGDGPWPVVLLRTPYGRMGGTRYAKQFKDDRVVFVTQDTRGRGNSAGTLDALNDENEIIDGNDTLTWIASQSWCNGRIGMVGGSGHGTCARMAYLGRHPNLLAIQAVNSAGPMYPYWSFENGVRTWLYRWPIGFRNGRDDGRKPTLPPARNEAHWAELVNRAAQDNPTVLFVDDGWFNIFGDGGAADDFVRFSARGHVYGDIAPRAHGVMKTEVKFPSASKTGPPPPSFVAILKGETNRPPSLLRYYVMGDIRDAAAPGNRWKHTSVWPPPHVEQSFYLTPTARLAAEPVAAATGSVGFVYDPRNPAPSLGGAYSFSEKDTCGPADQRPLLTRPDVLRFASDPLEQPLEIAGKIKLELFFSTDVPDTTIIVKLVDIYPDGLELLLREGAMLARFRDGFERPTPLTPGQVVPLAFSINSTAAVFNRGHRIGLYITSSSDPAYEVHPNTFEPVSGYELAPVAHQRIHTARAQASRVILPVVQP